MPSGSNIPLTYDYATELAFCDQVAKQLKARRDRDKTPLQIAGERLDLASILFRRASSDTRPHMEAVFASVQAEYFAAREAYLALLVEATGETGADLERRIAA
jgi:hypothetical protein